MNPKTKSTLLDILVGIISAIATFSLLGSFPFNIGFMVVSIVPVLAGYIRGKNPNEYIFVKVLLMNILFFLLIAAVMNGVFHLLLLIVVALTGTALGILLRQRREISKTKAVSYSAVFAISVICVGFFVLPPYFDYLLWSENGDPAPNYKFISMQGDTIRPSDHINKVVVIDFWATWCGPCKKELPVLEKIYQRYKGNKDVVFLMVNPMGKDSYQKAMDFIAKNPYDLPFAMDIKYISARKFNIRGLPALIVIDKSGIIRMTHTGFEESENLSEVLCEHVDGLLGEVQ